MGHSLLAQELNGVRITAQNIDSIEKANRQVTGKRINIQVNPIAMAMGIIGEGEIGGRIQFPLNESFGISIGAGYNTNGYVTGTGYTLQSAFLVYGDNGNYFAVQAFFRRWSIKGIQNYNGDFLNDILSPLSLINVPSGSNSDDRTYELDNAKVNVYGLDVMWGQQKQIFKSKHFLFDWYVGGGFRFKLATIEALGNYARRQFTPLPTPIYSNLSSAAPDIRCGFTIGYKL